MQRLAFGVLPLYFTTLPFSPVSRSELCLDLKTEDRLKNIAEFVVPNSAVENWRAAAREANPEQGARLIAILKDQLGLREVYEGSTGVWEGHSLETHTQMVFDRFNEVVLGHPLPDVVLQGSSMRELMLVTIALHDIGKPLAVEAGNIHQQHDFSLRLIRALLPKLKYHPQVVQLVTSLIESDFMGNLVRRRKSLASAYDELMAKAQGVGMNPTAWHQLAEFFYLCDATSYEAVLRQFQRDKQTKRFVDKLHALEALKSWVAGGRKRPTSEGGDIHTDAERQAFATLGGQLKEEARESWAPENFTQPEKFDARRFRLMVHAVKDPGIIYSMLTESLPRDYPYMSLSIISEEKTSTWDNTGIVVRMPKANIYGAEKEDMRASESYIRGPFPKDVQQGLTQLHSFRGLPSAEEVLRDAQATSSGLDHTEAFVVGRSAYGDTLEITGLMMKVDSLGKPFASPKAVNVLEKLAAAFKLPLLSIPPSRDIFVVRGKLLNEEGSTLIKAVEIHAAPGEFQKLVEQAKAKGKRLILADDGSPRGVFLDGKFAKPPLGWKEEWQKEGQPLTDYSPQLPLQTTNALQFIP